MLKIKWERAKPKRERKPSRVFSVLLAQTGSTQRWEAGDPAPLNKPTVTDRHGRILRWDRDLRRYIHEMEIPVNERGFKPWNRSETHRIVASYETWDQMINDCGPLTAA